MEEITFHFFFFLNSFLFFYELRVSIEVIGFFSSNILSNISIDSYPRCRIWAILAMILNFLHFLHFQSLLDLSLLIHIVADKMGEVPVFVGLMPSEESPLGNTLVIAHPIQNKPKSCSLGHVREAIVWMTKGPLTDMKIHVLSSERERIDEEIQSLLFLFLLLAKQTNKQTEHTKFSSFNTSHWIFFQAMLGLFTNFRFSSCSSPL